MNDTDILLENFPHIITFLRSIPEDIWDEFIPRGEYQMLLFENNLRKSKVTFQIRDKVIELQKKYGLPLRPNESLHRTMILIRIQEWKNRNDVQL